jgi:hypothetical protein
MLGTPTQAWYILRWLDNLPDEDLNKLFDKITKVKTLRGHNGAKSRPESSLGHVDDIWSESGRPFPSDATDDSVQSRGSPFMDCSLKEVQNQLESRIHHYRFLNRGGRSRSEKRSYAVPAEIGSKSDEASD